jgi:hypothetical protein
MITDYQHPTAFNTYQSCTTVHMHIYNARVANLDIVSPKSASLGILYAGGESDDF